MLQVVSDDVIHFTTDLPTRVRWVVTSRARGATLLNAPITGSDQASLSTPIYLAEVVGTFVDQAASVPPGASSPTGSILMLMIDGESGDLVGLSLQKVETDLRTVGTPTTSLLPGATTTTHRASTSTSLGSYPCGTQPVAASTVGLDLTLNFSGLSIDDPTTESPVNATVTLHNTSNRTITTSVGTEGLVYAIDSTGHVTTSMRPSTAPGGNTALAPGQTATYAAELPLESCGSTNQPLPAGSYQMAPVLDIAIDGGARRIHVVGTARTVTVP
jgi:hypothetical protein